MDNQEILNDNFLTELFKLCLKRREIIDVCKKVLKYNYLPSAGYKEIWKQIQNEYDFTHSIPTLGVLYENCKTNDKALEVLNEIKEIGEPNENQVVKTLESFIKDSMCIQFYDDFQSYYVNNKKEKAIALLKETNDKLNHFSLSSEYLFSSTFKDFRDRQYDKKIDKEFASEDFGFLQPVTGIDELDYLYPVNVKSNPLYCLLARSGTGKTTHLIFSAIENARKGAKVLFIASEGTEQELQDKLDACWTAKNKVKIENADLSDEEISKLNAIAEKITAMGGEVTLHVFKQFGKATMLDVNNIIGDYEKTHGQVPDVVILDYLELFTVADKSVNDEKYRRQAVAREFSNILTSRTIKFGLTATQASNVDESLVNSEEFVLTRNNISGDKNLLDCFSLFYSLNQTESEYQNEVMRLFVDKSRHSSKKIKQTIHIYTDFDHGVFYNRKKTIQEFATSLV